MERKFMVYQRRDGFQIAEEATGTRLENGMEFLARPNKSGLWCTAAFNVVIDDNYELVGEEVIDCSHQPVQVLCFVDGVMKTIVQSRIAIEDMIERAEDAISDRNIPAARAWKIDIDAAIEQCHAEALEIDEAINIAVWVIKAMAGHDIEAVLAGVRSGLYRSGLYRNASITDVYMAGYTALRIAIQESHAEALGVNTEFDEKAANRHIRWCEFFGNNDYAARQILINEAYAEALEMNNAQKNAH